MRRIQQMFPPRQSRESLSDMTRVAGGAGLIRALLVLTVWLAVLLGQSSQVTHRPANVPQRHANQAAHARYAVHARTFLLGGFVSVENKERCIQLPKLRVR